MKLLLATIGSDLTIVGNASLAIIGVPYSIALSAVGGTGAKVFSLTASDNVDMTLTDNLDSTASLDIADPDTPGTFTVSVKVKDENRQTRTKTFIYSVEALPVEISGTLGAMTVGVVFSADLAITGGTGVYSALSVSAGALPAGITANIVGTDIHVAGTPTVGGAWAASLTVTDSEGDTGTIALSGTVTQAVAITGSFPTTVETGETIDWTLPVTGGTGSYSSVVVQTGSKPSWMTIAIDGTDVRATGTADDVGATYSFTLRVTDSGSSIADSSAQSVEVTGDDWTLADLGAAPNFWLNENTSRSVDGFGGVTEWWTVGNTYKTEDAGGQPDLLTAELDGKDVVQFNGTGERLYVSIGDAGGIFKNVSYGYQSFVVRKTNVDSPVKSRVLTACQSGASGNSRFVVTLGNASSGANIPVAFVRRLDGDSLSTCPFVSPIGTEWHVITYVADFFGGNVYAYLDGELVSTTALSSSGGNTSNTTGALGLMLGAYANGTTGQAASNTWCDASLAETAISGTTLAAGELDKMHGYLAWKWGLEANLDGSHAYKLGRPVKPAP